MNATPQDRDPAPPQKARVSPFTPARWRLVHAATAVVILGFDLWTKRLAETLLPMRGGTVPVIDGFLSLALVHNTGAAFGLFSQADPRITSRALNLVALVALTVVATYWWKSPAERGKLGFGLTLVFAGALGNLIDRFTFGYVIDFIEVYWRTFHWPNFNVADSAISVGVGLLVLDSFSAASEPLPDTDETGKETP